MKAKEISTTQINRATQFDALHRSGVTLALPNAWDAASACVFESVGFMAIGTSSAGIAFSRGYPDGARIPLAEMKEAVRRIVAVVNVPVTVDIEAGFGTTSKEVLNTVSEMLDVGAVGINLEDAPRAGFNELRDCDEQANLIESIRAMANKVGINLYINARTDVYWLKFGKPETRLNATIARLCAYRKAGATGVFVPGLTDSETISAIVNAVDCPLNILAAPGCTDIAGLTQLGVARLSLGSGPVRAIMGLARRIGEEFLNVGDFQTMFTNTIPYDTANLFFDKSHVA